MTTNELNEFKRLFGVYCRQEIDLGHCRADTCEYCPIETAYQEVLKFQKIKVHIFDIEWDVGDDDVSDENLPTELEHEFNGYSEINDELIDEVSEWLSEEYVYCPKNFVVNISEKG